MSIFNYDPRTCMSPCVCVVCPCSIGPYYQVTWGELDSSGWVLLSFLVLLYSVCCVIKEQVEISYGEGTD